MVLPHRKPLTPSSLQAIRKGTPLSARDPFLTRAADRAGHPERNNMARLPPGHHRGRRLFMKCRLFHPSYERRKSAWLRFPQRHPRQTVPQGHHTSRVLARRETISAYLFMLPSLLFFVGFVLVPMGMCLVYSFLDMGIDTSAATFAGFANYIEMCPG